MVPIKKSCLIPKFCQTFEHSINIEMQTLNLQTNKSSFAVVLSILSVDDHVESFSMEFSP